MFHHVTNFNEIWSGTVQKLNVVQSSLHCTTSNRIKMVHHSYIT